MAEYLDIIVRLKKSGAAGIKEVEKDIKGVGAAASSSTGILRGFVGQLAAIAATVGAGTFLKSTVTTFAEFDDVMRQAGAVTGATKEEMQAMTDVAKEMGATTRYTASQSADGLRLMGMAGFEAQEAIDALPGVLNLAAAGSLDLGTAADIATNILSGFGLEVENLGRVNDVLVKTFTSSNTTLTELGEAFKLVGPIAKGVGADFEELLAAIGRLGDAGLKGTLAGTALRGAIDALLNPTKEEAALLKQLAERAGQTSFTVKDAQGNFIGFKKVIEQLEAAGLKGDEALKLFGQRAGPGMAALLQVGSKGLGEFTGTLKTVGPVSQEIASEMEAGIGGAIRETKSAFEAVKIAIGEAFGDDIIKAIRTAKEYLLDWVNVIKEMKSNGTIEAYAETARIAFEVITKAVKTAYHEVDSFTKLVIAGISAVSGDLETAKIALDDYVKGNDKFLEQKGLIAAASVRQKKAIEEEIEATQKQINLIKEKIQRNKEDLNGWRAKVLGTKAYQEEIQKNQEKLDALEAKMSGLSQKKATFEAKIEFEGIKALEDVGTWTRDAGKTLEDAAKPSGPIGKGTQKVQKTASTIINPEEVKRSLASSLSVIRAELDTESAAIESEYSQGLLKLDEYYAQREAIIKRRIQSETNLLQQAASAENDPKKKDAINAQIYIKEQELERSLIELENDRYEELKRLDEKKLQDQQKINDAKLKAEQAFNDQKERVRDVGQGLDAEFQKELADLQERQNREREIVEKGLQDQAQIKEFYRNQELEKDKLLQDQKKRLQEAQLETAAGIAGSLSDVFGSVYEATGKKQKEFFYAQKAAAVAQATINIAQGITKAWGQGGIWGAIGAAAVATAGALQIAKILSTGYAEGGEVKGHSPHSKADNIPARLTAGEYVMPVSAVQKYGKGTMEALRQQAIPKEALSNFSMPGIRYGSSHFASGGAVSAGPSGESSQGQQKAEFKIINYTDRNELLSALATPEGQDAMVNVISSNREKISRVLR